MGRLLPTACKTLALSLIWMSTLEGVPLVLNLSLLGGCLCLRGTFEASIQPNTFCFLLLLSLINQGR